MEDLMHNKEYLQNVLRSLPGVNPEEALHNLERMSQTVLEQKDEKSANDKKDEVCVCVCVRACVCVHAYTHNIHGVYERAQRYYNSLIGDCQSKCQSYESTINHI